MLISPTEPARIKEIGKVSPLPERYGCDLLCIGKGKKVGIQRKKFPEDLLSSLNDGRLVQQVQQMQHLTGAMIILEGFGQWTGGGELMGQWGATRFTKAQLYALIMSLYVEWDIEVFQVKDMNETIAFVEVLDRWIKKDRHNSLRTRPGPPKNSWGTRDNRDYAIHVLQSFPGVGAELAARMVDHFGGLPLDWSVSEKELLSVPGVGKGKAATLIKALERIDNEQ